MSLLEDDRKLLARVDEHAKGLTPWEVEFVASLVERLAETNEGGRALSDKQRAILERIDDEKVS